jgi:ATP-dependent exoDNAse (exonuclease V) beta subunit
MDLVFEYDGECIIIDFKTDRHQQAEQHAVQLAVYARAAPAFSKLPVKTAVAYLRTGSILEIDHNQVSAERIISLARETREQHA